MARRTPSQDRLDAALGNNLGTADPAPAVVAKVAPVGMPETVRIVLEENDNIPSIGQFFGINGVGYLLKPGVEANVPIGIKEILDNAVEKRPIVSTVTNEITGWSNRHRYPYRLVQAA